MGKGTVASRLTRVVEGLKLSKSWTSRPARANEDPEAYHFCSRSDFEVAASAGRFLEWAEFNGNLYGTPLPETSEREDLLLEIDAQGACSVRKLDPSAIIFLLLPPSEEALVERMSGRGDPQSHIDQRVSLARREIDLARAVADYEIVNREVDEAVAEIASIIEGARNSRL